MRSQLWSVERERQPCPGDLIFSILGRKIELPFMSTILLAVLALVLGKLLF